MKILVPIDGSKSSQKSLVVAKEYGEKLDADLVIFTVVPEMTIFEQYPTNFEYSLEVDNANKERAKSILEEAKNEFNDYKNNVETIFTVGSPATQICRFAEKENMDLIIIGNRGLGAFSRTLLGSVSNKVLNHSKTSVLVVKQD